MARNRIAPALAYPAVALLASLLLIWGMRLDLYNPHDPLGYNGGDVMLILPMAQAVSETGSQWHHPRLGAPGEQDLYDFPVVDYLHFAGVRLLQLASGDLLTAFNLYFLLTYPLTALTTTYALRRLGLSWPAALCGAILYAFTPYHQARNLGHYFLSAYYVVPLTLVLAVEMAAGREGVGSRRWWLGAAVIAALTSLAGAYYAYFGCAALAFAGIYGTAATRSWWPLGRAAGVVAVVVLGGVLGHLPAIRYQAEAGRNPAPTFRLPDEAETYGLKLTQLLLPIQGHRLVPFDAARARYDSPQRPVQTENSTSTLGLVASLGLVALLILLLLPVSGPVRAIAALTGFLILFGTVGGVGALFNHLVSPQVRAYCRVSILLAFLGLLATCVALDRAAPRAWIRWPLFLIVCALGVLDQTNTEWFSSRIAPGRKPLAQEYRDDRAFYSQVDAVEGAMVFCLPYIAYPETTQVGALAGYDHGRGVIHTETARWSFGAMKGRVGDEWLRETSALPVPQLLDRLAARGFTHLYIHTKGYAPPDAARLLAELRKYLGSDAELTPHADGARRLFDLRSYAARRAAELGGLEAIATADREAVRAEWLAGFVGFEPPGELSRLHLMHPRAEMVLVNPAGHVQRLHVTFAARTLGGKSQLTIDAGAIWAGQFPLEVTRGEFGATIEVPPGRHTVRWNCPTPEGMLPGDGKRAVAEVADLTLTRDE